MNKIDRKSNIELNYLSDTDSYKHSHYLQYVPNMTRMMSYLESRGGRFDECTLFGLQYVLHRYLSKPISQADVDVEEKFALEHGLPFNREGWEHIALKYGGRLPVTIRAIPEGTVVPTGNVILTVESVDDEKCAWITNYVETMLSRIWYPSTVAILSKNIKEIWMDALMRSSDNPLSEISFKHHDFGSRGVACQEQAMIGGAAHLLNFLGSDTTVGIKFANHYYDSPMAGFSIPATEHSTMTVWGESGEREAIENWIRKTLLERSVPDGVPKMSACVGDSYDIYRFVNHVCDLRELVKKSNGTLVIRPDSGDPIEVLSKIFTIFDDRIADEITVNSKGYKVLPSYLRIIWGDGVNIDSMKSILDAVIASGWSASNIAFGSGGGLLQSVNRDTQRFAFKCSFVEAGGKSINVRKNPSTDRTKSSKAGRLDLIKVEGEYHTVTLDSTQKSHDLSVMVTVFENGEIVNHTNFDDCRKRMTK